ncbi:MAG: DUF992 domain-containing protein [Pseudomonadota bacterium]
MKRYALTLAAVLFGAVAAWPTAPANANMGVKVGALTCHIDGGLGLIVASRKTLECRFDGLKTADEVYDGSITKIGVDIGATEGGQLVWGVFAPTSDLKRGALEGHYYGVSAEATAGVGVGANVLVGGFDKSIFLQPLSVQGQTGANIAAGVSALKLESVN